MFIMYERRVLRHYHFYNCWLTNISMENSMAVLCKLCIKSCSSCHGIWISYYKCSM